MKIRRILIHLLGGVTEKEHTSALDKKYHQGMKDMANDILAEMKRIYGVPVNEWCGHMYTSVSMRASSC